MTLWSEKGTHSKKIVILMGEEGHLKTLSCIAAE